MKPPVLTLVAPADDSPASRVARLQAEMKVVANDVYTALLDTLELGIKQAREVEALTALPSGVRDEARRTADRIGQHVNHMTSIRGRV